MNIESESGGEIEPQLKVDVEPGYERFVPEDFRDDPIRYFEHLGTNVKSGEIEMDATGRVKEDPRAVRDFPVWFTEEAELAVVGKRVNVEKAEIGKSGDPFYEFGIMKKVRAVGLPASNPIAKAEHGGTHLVIMERIPGFRWSSGEEERLRESGFSKEDVDRVIDEARTKMEELRSQFETAGIRRTWKLADMIFDVNLEAKRLRSITPTDWERTVIDDQQYEAYKKEHS